MGTPLNPINVRIPVFDLETAEGRAEGHRYLASGIVDLNQAVAALNNKLTAAKPSSTTTIIQTGGGGGGGGGGSVIGGVNNQIGASSYTTRQSDNGVKVLMGAALSPTVNLNASVTTPWFCWIGNDSSAVVNLDPTSGSLFGQNYVAPGLYGMVFFDGTNFWSEGTPIAQDSSLGIVRPDDVTIHVDSGGVLSTIGATGTIHIPSVDSGMAGSITVSNGLITNFVNPT